MEKNQLFNLINDKDKIIVKNNILKMFFWVILANLCLGLGLYYVTGKLAAPIMPIVLILGFIGPLISLFISKWQAKKTFNLMTLSPDDFFTEKEKFYYNIVEAMSIKLNIKAPEICVWNSSEINAFATGSSKNKALIAVSSSLLNELNEEELVGVIGHEMAHIVNGDMLTLTLLKGVVNTVVWVICAPLLLVHWFMKSDKNGAGIWLVISYFVYNIVKKIVSFGGVLVANWFSRHREFKADKLSAELTSKECIENALRKLKRIQFVKVEPKQVAYAAFKINSEPSFLDILSTHPNLERRIQKLNLNKKEK